MDDKVKKIGTIAFIVLFVIFDIFFSFKWLPDIMSGGNSNVRMVLSEGKTAQIVPRDIDISNSKESVNPGDSVYISKGVNNKLVISHKKTTGAIPAEVVDVSENKARVNIFYSGVQQNKFRFPGLTVFKFIVFFLLILFLVIILQKFHVIKNLSLPSSSSRPRFVKKYGDQGSANESTVSDLRDIMGNDGIALSRNVRLSMKKSLEHIAIIGPTGSGKSSSFFIPNLLDFNGMESGVVSDPKRELYNTCSTYLRKMGYNIITIDPLHPDQNGLKFDPLLNIDNISQARDIAQLILTNGNKSVEIMTNSSSSGAEWINMAIPILTAAFIYVIKFGEKKSISEAVDIILTNSLEEMEEKFKKDPVAYRNFLIFKSSSESEKTMSSIKSVLSTDVQLFLDPNVDEFTTPNLVYNARGEKVADEKTLFNPDILRKKPTVVFVFVAEKDSTKMMPLMSVFYNVLFDRNMENIDGLPIFYMLDEFANIGVIPLIDTVATTGRSRKMGLCLGVQGIEQICRNYGKENASSILNNLKTKLIYGGLTGDSAQYVSDLSGITTVESISVSNNGGMGNQDIISNLIGSRSVSKSGVSRPLYTKDEVRRIDKNYVLIITNDKQPVKDFKNSWFEQKKYKSKIEQGWYILVLNFTYSKNERVYNCSDFISTINKKFKSKYIKKKIPVNKKYKYVICKERVSALDYSDNFYQYAIITFTDGFRLILTKDEFSDQKYVYDIVIGNSLVILNPADSEMFPLFSSINIIKEVKLNLDEDKDMNALREFFIRKYDYFFKNIIDYRDKFFKFDIYNNDTKLIINKKRINVKLLYKNEENIFAAKNDNLIILDKTKLTDDWKEALF